ncbi:hypothetical protein VTI74DRAFT_544 [Chaetomium olivicolor]
MQCPRPQSSPNCCAPTPAHRAPYTRKKEQITQLPPSQTLLGPACLTLPVPPAILSRRCSFDMDALTIALKPLPLSIPILLSDSDLAAMQDRSSDGTRLRHEARGMGAGWVGADAVGMLKWPRHWAEAGVPGVDPGREKEVNERSRFGCRVEW